MSVEVTSAVLKYTSSSAEVAREHLTRTGSVSTVVRLGVGDMQPLQVSSWRTETDGSLVVYLKRASKPDSPV